MEIVSILKDAYRINADATRRLSRERWTVWSHREYGKRKADPAGLRLFLNNEQVSGKRIEGEKLFSEIVHKPVAGATVMDGLLRSASPVLDTWCPPDSDSVSILRLRKEILHIYFWGTLLQAPDDRLYVQYLYCMCGVWRFSSNSLNCLWNDKMPAVTT